jgi:hypothetical protein
VFAAVQTVANADAVRAPRRLEADIAAQFMRNLLR